VGSRRGLKNNVAEVRGDGVCVCVGGGGGSCGFSPWVRVVPRSARP
jgi:hypothetical protein